MKLLANTATREATLPANPASFFRGAPKSRALVFMAALSLVALLAACGDGGSGGSGGSGSGGSGGGSGSSEGGGSGSTANDEDFFWVTELEKNPQFIPRYDKSSPQQGEEKKEEPKPAHQIGESYQLPYGGFLRTSAEDPGSLLPAGAWVRVERTYQQFEYVESKMSNGTDLGRGWLTVYATPQNGQPQ